MTLCASLSVALKKKQESWIPGIKTLDDVSIFDCVFVVLVEGIFIFNTTYDTRLQG